MGHTLELDIKTQSVNPAFESNRDVIRGHHAGLTLRDNCRPVSVLTHSFDIKGAASQHYVRLHGRALIALLCPSAHTHTHFDGFWPYSSCVIAQTLHSGFIIAGPLFRLEERTQGAVSQGQGVSDSHHKCV